MTFLIVYSIVGILSFLITSFKLKWDYWSIFDVIESFAYSGLFWPAWAWMNLTEYFKKPKS